MGTTEQLLTMAKQIGHPVTLRNQQTITVFLPTGYLMTVQEVREIPRNRSFFVTPDAIKSPGMLMQRTNDMCVVWFAWFDGALHGQFHTEQDAMNAMLA